jgi:hypothetical protein
VALKELIENDDINIISSPMLWSWNWFADLTPSMAQFHHLLSPPQGSYPFPKFKTEGRETQKNRYKSWSQLKAL